MKHLTAFALALILTGCGTSTYTQSETVDESAILETVWTQRTVDEQTEICAGVLLYGTDWAAGQILQGDTSDVLSYDETVNFLSEKCL